MFFAQPEGIEVQPTRATSWVNSEKIFAVRFLISLCFFLFFIPTSPAYTEEPILVKLSYDYPLLDVYLAPVDSDGSLPETYIRSLLDVLTFDFQYNGMTKVMVPSNALSRFATPSMWSQSSAQDSLKQAGVDFVLVLQIAQKKAQLSTFSLSNREKKSTQELPLTGNLAEDRKVIHRLSDSSFFNLFGKNGIAQSKFIFVRQNNDYTIQEADYDGYNVQPLFQNKHLLISPGYIPAKPGFIPATYFYVSYEQGQPKIFAANIKGGKPGRLTSLKGNQLMPTFSRDRQFLAFISDAAGNPDLFLQELDAEGSPKDKPRQIFAGKRTTQASPTFSPDGSKVAFVSDKDGAPRIYVMTIPADGVTIQNIKTKLISTKTRESSAPSWSPDGTKIAFCGKGKDGVRQIWIVDMQTNEERQLTTGSDLKENPSWAPDSLHLLFNSVIGDKSEIYLINLHQADAVKLPLGAGSKRFPAWKY